MPLTQFCDNYRLGINVLKKLQENSYFEAHTLRFVTIAELKQMEFRLGEIVAMRDAVEAWSILKVD